MKKWENPAIGELAMEETREDANTCYCSNGEAQAIDAERKPGGGHEWKPGNPCPSDKPHHKPGCGCHHCKPGGGDTTLS